MLLKLSFSALIVLNLTLLVRSTLTSCQLETRIWHFNYFHRWITVMGLPNFNSLRLSNLGYLCLMWWFVTSPVPIHYLPHYKPLKNDLYWTLKQIRRISFWKCYSKCRLPPSLCWISVHLYVSTLTSCLPETRVYHFIYCHGRFTFLGISDFNSLRLLN